MKEITEPTQFVMTQNELYLAVCAFIIKREGIERMGPATFSIVPSPTPMGQLMVTGVINPYDPKCSNHNIITGETF